MSRLEELIQELCPDGVEYKRLEDICHITRGRVISKDYLRDNTGEYPVYSSQTANNGIFGYINSFDFDCESITWTTDGANAGSVFYHINEKFSITNVCGLLRVVSCNEVNTKFIYYVLQIVAKRYVYTGMGNPKLMSNVMGTITIPLPPLPIQQEIVRILYTFTALEAELEAELDKRKAQYEYYKDELLSFGDDVKKIRLGDLFEFKNGLNKGKEFFGKGTPIVNFTDVYHKGKLTRANLHGRVSVTESEFARFEVKKGDVFFTRTSETKEDIGMVSVMVEDIHNCVFSGFVLRARPKTGLLLADYCAYCFSFPEIRNLIVRTSSFTTRALTSGTILSKIEIPVPPLPEQERIVAILDRFDALVNDITQGLPAEIAARRKQYEYYRDKLLTFQRKEVAQ